MMMCYRFQKKADAERFRAEGEIPAWTGGRGLCSSVAKCSFPKGDFNIERIKRISSADDRENM